MQHTAHQDFSISEEHIYLCSNLQKKRGEDMWGHAEEDVEENTVGDSWKEELHARGSTSTRDCNSGWPTVGARTETAWESRDVFL